MRTPNDLARELAKLGDTLDAAARHHRARNEADAALHMSATVRPSPLTVALDRARDDAERLRIELLESTDGGDT